MKYVRSESQFNPQIPAVHGTNSCESLQVKIKSENKKNRKERTTEQNETEETGNLLTSIKFSAVWYRQDRKSVLFDSLSRRGC
jgi:hypothetical protein